MATFYAEYNKRSILSAPDFNRSRHALRSPRDSYSINLESEQFRYSIKKLYSKQETLKTEMIAKGNTLTEGGEVTVEYNQVGATPNYINVEGLENLAARILDTKRRIKELERVL